MTTHRSGIAVGVALLAIIVCAAAVRLIGIDSGRPYAYHQDEWLVFRPAMAMVHERDWNPHAFLYPSLLIDLQAVLTGVLRWFGGPPLVTDQGWLFSTELLPVQFRYLVGGRLLVMALGLTTILITFEIGRRSRTAGAGIVAAAVLAATPLHISDSRLLTTDVPVAMFCALTLLFTVKAGSDGRERWWLLAGVAAGLAISTKWSGALVVGVPLLAFFLSTRDTRDIGARMRSRTPYLVIAAALLALVVTTPALLSDATEVAAALQLQAGAYSTPRSGMASNVLALNLSGLISGLDPIVAVLSCLGLARLVLRPRRRIELVIPAFVAMSVIVVSIPARQYDRNLVPILPYLAVATGCFIADFPEIAGGTTRRVLGSGGATHARRAVMGLTIVALTCGLAVGFGAGLASGQRAKDVDTRSIAREWILANVARNTVIARERETPMLMPGEYRLRPRSYLAGHPLDWYRRAGTQLLVTSSFAYGRYLGNPSTPDQDAWYRALFTLHEIFKVEPGPGRPGPSIHIYQLAPFTYRDGAPSG